MTNPGRSILLATLVLLTFEPALAHHAMDNALPQTVFQGLISGIGHPVIGIDHLAFAIGIGIAAAFTTRPLLGPFAFVSATMLGCLLLLNGFVLPIVETMIAVSVFVIGVLVLAGRRLKTRGGIGLFFVAGLFHGYAYGESIVGAESSPIIAYLAGFVAVQFFICLVASQVTRSAISRGENTALYPRLAGAMIAGIRNAVRVENIEFMVFA